MALLLYSDSLGLRPRDPLFRADPYPLYRQLRAVDPVHYDENTNGWLITRYADAMLALKDARLGHPELPSRPPIAAERSPWQRIGSSSSALMYLWLSLRNPPDNRRLRQVLHKAFTPAALAALEPRIRDHALRLAAALQDRAALDFVADFAELLPFEVIADMLGLPSEDRPQLRRLSAMLGAGIDLQPDQVVQARSWMALGQLADYFRRLIARRRGEPACDGTLLNLLLDGREREELSEDELVAQCILMLFAGHSSAQALIANVVYGLLRHPDQLQLLLAERDLINPAIEEFLRWDPPIQVVDRWSLAEIAIGGKVIPAGQVVFIVLAAANRDPAVFPDPDRLDVRRSPNPHLGFGHGVHFCLGQRVGRLLAQHSLAALLDLLPSFRIKHEALRWDETLLLRSLRSLPLIAAT